MCGQPDKKSGVHRPDRPDSDASGSGASGVSADHGRRVLSDLYCGRLAEGILSPASCSDISGRIISAPFIC